MYDSIRGALARGYCTKRNENKVLDANLIEDMVIEVEKFLQQLLRPLLEVYKDFKDVRQTDPELYKAASWQAIEAVFKGGQSD